MVSIEGRSAKLLQGTNCGTKVMLNIGNEAN